MDALTLLTTRNSATKLRFPAPDAQALQTMIAAAQRAPDHARLRPWRFLVIEGDEGRKALGELFVDALLKGDPDTPEGTLRRMREVPFRAPRVMVAIARVVEHPKVPKVEQLLAAGCAAHGVLLAAPAQGDAGIWRTGPLAYDANVNQGLGLAEDETVVGFLYLGTQDGKTKALPSEDPAEFISRWPGAGA